MGDCDGGGCMKGLEEGVSLVSCNAAMRMEWSIKKIVSSEMQAIAVELMQGEGE